MRKRSHCRLGARTRIGNSPNTRFTRTTVSPGVPPTPPLDTYFMLLESNDFMLQENTDKMLQEIG